MDHIAQTHRIGEPAHRLLHIAAALGIAGLLLMGLGEQSQPAEGAGLHHQEIELIGLALGDPLALLLHQQPQPQIVEMGHPARLRCHHTTHSVPFWKTTRGGVWQQGSENPKASLTDAHGSFGDLSPDQGLL